MTELLEMSLAEFFNPVELQQPAGAAPGQRVKVLEARVVRAIQLDTGGSWMNACERFYKGIEGAHSAGDPTVRGAITHAFADPEFVAQSVRLLELRDEAVERVYERASTSSKLKTDDRGLVFLDQGDGLTAKSATSDIGKALTDPQERETRYQRALNAGRALGDPQYRYDAMGEDGRKVFDQEDRMQLEAGRDLVCSLELAVENLANHRQGEQVAHQTAFVLDQAIERAGQDRAQMRLLDQQLAELDSAGVDFDDAHERIQRRGRNSLAPTVQVLLELAVIDKKKGKKKRRDATLRLLEQHAATADVGADDSLTALPGVHPGSHLLDQRVRERMAELDTKDYVMVLDQILEEDA